MEQYIKTLEQLAIKDKAYADVLSVIREEFMYANIIANKYTQGSTYGDVTQKPLLEKASFEAKKIQENLFNSDFQYAADEFPYDYLGKRSRIVPSAEGSIESEEQYITHSPFSDNNVYPLKRSRTYAEKAIQLNVYSGDNLYVDDIDFTGLIPHIKPSMAKKSMMNYGFSAREDGSANPAEQITSNVFDDSLETYLRYGAEPKVVDGQNPIYRLIDGLKPGTTRATYHFVTKSLEHFQTLAQLNPRFNRYINPLYYIGIDGIEKQNPYLEQFKNGNDTSALEQQHQSIKDNFPKGPFYSDIVTKFGIPNTDIALPSTYEELVGGTKITTQVDLWDTLKSFGRGRVENLLDDAFDVADNIFHSDFASDISNLLKTTTGVDTNVVNNTLFNGIKELVGNKIGSPKTNYDYDPNDVSTAAKYGLNLGQVKGKKFVSSLDGFNQTPFQSMYSKDNQLSGLRTYIKKLMGKENLDVQQGDLANWYLPNTQLANSNLDKVMKYGGVPKPSTDNFMSILLKDASAIWQPTIPGTLGALLQPNFLDNAVGNLTDLFNKTKNTTTSLADDLSNFSLGDIGSNISDTFKSIGESLSFKNPLSNTDFGAVLSSIGIGGISPTQSSDKYFLTRYQPTTPSIDQQVETWDNTIDTVLQGSDEIDKRTPYIAPERHRNFIEKTPVFNKAQWFIVDNQRIFEKSNEPLISNYSAENVGNTKIPNIKTLSEQGKTKILDAKIAAADTDKLIFEGVQQVGGSFNGVKYDSTDDPFSPQSTSVDLGDFTYLANVRSSRIDDILHVKKGVPKSYDISPELMAAEETQYFPFWIRTINREDYAIVQQPYYQNGAVFMSKRRVTGSSIVFLEAAIDSINEGFQASISRDMFMGRTDPILFHNGVSRTFSISFTMMASAPQDVASNRAKYNELIRMMYPQIMSINEIGTVAFRRPPMVELRVGDMYWLYGMIEGLQIDPGAESKIWETLPGGRVYRDMKYTLSLAIVHEEQPGAHFDFGSRSFKPQIFKPSTNGKFAKV